MALNNLGSLFFSITFVIALVTMIIETVMIRLTKVRYNISKQDYDLTEFNFADNLWKTLDGICLTSLCGLIACLTINTAMGIAHLTMLVFVIYILLIVITGLINLVFDWLAFVNCNNLLIMYALLIWKRDVSLHE